MQGCQSWETSGRWCCSSEWEGGGGAGGEEGFLFCEHSVLCNPSQPLVRDNLPAPLLQWIPPCGPSARQQRRLRPAAGSSSSSSLLAVGLDQQRHSSAGCQVERHGQRLSVGQGPEPEAPPQSIPQQVAAPGSGAHCPGPGRQATGAAPSPQHSRGCQHKEQAVAKGARWQGQSCAEPQAACCQEVVAIQGH
jgi:hypothetical protein